MLLPHLWADPTPVSEPALAAVSGGMGSAVIRSLRWIRVRMPCKEREFQTVLNAWTHQEFHQPHQA